MKQTCSARRRASHPRRVPADIRHEFVRRLDGVEFHINALRFRAGLPHNLSADEQAVVLYAVQAVDNGLAPSDVFDAEQWRDVWGRWPSPLLVQALAIELSWRQDALALADALGEG